MKKWLIVAAVVLAGLVLVVYNVTERNKASVAVNHGAPGIVVSDIATMKKISFSDIKGKVMFINFWATWCPPCREEAHSVDALYRQFKANPNFTMITILYRDDPQNGLDFIKQTGFKFPVMLDISGTAARTYGLTGVPETYILDKRGVLRKKVIGAEQWDTPENLSFISGLLKE